MYKHVHFFGTFAVDFFEDSDIRHIQQQILEELSMFFFFETVYYAVSNLVWNFEAAQMALSNFSARIEAECGVKQQQLVVLLISKNGD